MTPATQGILIICIALVAMVAITTFGNKNKGDKK